jgi:hypothetical protein
MTDRSRREEDVYATEAEGQSYRGSSYTPTAYDNLDVAPESPDYPSAGRSGSDRSGPGRSGSDQSASDRSESGYRLRDLPRVPRLSQVLGPSAVLLGASLGSGETLFWPLLVAIHGWDIYWLFLVAVGTQYFINTEIQRWTVATGESVFRGFERVARGWPLVFLLLGFVSLGWPGWAATAAEIGTAGLGLREATLSLGGGGGTTLFAVPAWKLLGVALLVLVWLSYQVTPVMYNVVEGVQVVLVTLAVVSAVVLSLALGAGTELTRLPSGLAAVGTLPPGFDVALVLGGLAFAGAGGYLNLSQSLWVREKGYGMGRFQGRVKNPVVGDDPEPVHRDGFTFPPTRNNLLRWRGWWRLVQLEHLLTFVVGLVVTATVLMAMATTYAAGTTEDAVAVWTGQVIPQLGDVAGVLLVVVLFVALFTTEYGIVESVVRNSTDVIYELYGRQAGWSLPRIFWTVLTLFVLWGILLLFVPVPLAVSGPFGLLVAGAVLSGLMMWPYTALLTVLVTTRLPEHTQPGWLRTAALWWGTALFGYFGALLGGNWLATTVGLSVFGTEVGVLGSAPGGPALFAAVAVVQIAVVSVSARAKLAARDTVVGDDETRGVFD